MEDRRDRMMRAASITSLVGKMGFQLMPLDLPILDPNARPVIFWRLGRGDANEEEALE